MPPAAEGVDRGWLAIQASGLLRDGASHTPPVKPDQPGAERLLMEPKAAPESEPSSQSFSECC